MYQIAPQSITSDISVHESYNTPEALKFEAWVCGNFSQPIYNVLNLYTDPSQVANPDARQRIESGERVKGWFSHKSREIFLYLPNMESAKDVAATFMHEAVAHKGLRQMLGKAYENLCRQYYNQMSEEQKEYWANYAGVTRDGVVDEVMAGDEAIARMAEDVNMEDGTTLWQRLGNMVRDFFRRFFDIRYTDAEIATLIRASYRNLAQQAGSQQSENRESETTNQSGSLSYSISRSNDEFSATLAQAVHSKGIVTDGLYQMTVPIVNVPRHSFQSDKPISEARL